MLVTGGARGIGAAIVRAAVQAGFRVAINYANSAVEAARLANELGNGTIAVQADVGSEPEVVSMFNELDRHWDHIDCLVNNAGVAGSYGTLDTVTADMLTALLTTNVTGAFICAREAVRRMPPAVHGGGTIINISSKAATLGGANEWVHYAASKGALESMTTGLARELAPRNIRVNAVRPGLVENNFGPAPSDRIERMAPAIPMGRPGTLAEVAAAVVWLAAGAPDYLTGTFVDVSGGR
jgi:NAD(P)-dependent dehydrogenase (short-subunit alcohol dehydrogenase family)